MMSRVCLHVVSFFCFKQKTAYEMRISDWSSDVCSSDLHHTNAPAWVHINAAAIGRQFAGDKPQQGRSEEHTSELQSLMRISYAVFCLKQKHTDNSTTLAKSSWSQFYHCSNLDTTAVNVYHITHSPVTLTPHHQQT